jgi:glycine/D-amino acid oxidase-like deaminating enzyme
VVGGGFTGLWTALLAKESFPDRSVVLAEGHRVGWAASGRNGGFERTGSIGVATEEYQVDGLRAAADSDGGTFLDARAMRAEVNSPTYLAGLWDTRGAAMVQPARLAWGLAALDAAGLGFDS